MTVSSSLLVDRAAKIQHLDDACRSEVEVLTKNLYQFLIGKFTGAEGIYSYGSRSCYTDCIGKLNLTLVSQSCSNDVLRCVTCCVSCGTVYLGAVFSGECAAAVTGISAVGVYDDLTSGQSAVSVRSADNETSSRVDEELGVCIYHVCRENRIENIFLNVSMDLFLGNFLTVLGGKNNSFQTKRFAVLIVLYGNLGLSIRTKVRKRTVFTNVGQSLCQFVSKRDGVRHQLRSLVGCITEHHTLIACADCFQLAVIHEMLFCFQCFVNAHGDIGGLLINGSDDCTVVSVESEFSSGVSDLADGVADDLLDIYVSFGSDLTHNQYKTGGGAGLTSNTAHGILSHQRVQDGIGNLVTDFVRMAFSYGLGSK